MGLWQEVIVGHEEMTCEQILEEGKGRVEHLVALYIYTPSFPYEHRVVMLENWQIWQGMYRLYLFFNILLDFILLQIYL